MARVLKKIFRGLLTFVIIIVILAAALVGPIDRTPLQERDFYQTMMSRLDTTHLLSKGAGVLKAGWTKVNITPSIQMPMAGYMARDHYTTVHDSLYARILVLDNGAVRVAMIDVDLLIFPPALRDKLYALKPDQTFLYLSATHTHNGVGGWDPSVAGRLITGKYSEDWVNQIARRIDAAMNSITVKDAAIQYFSGDATDLVENRVNVDSAKVDGGIRGVRIHRNDSAKAILFAFSAHATSIQKDIYELSADYAGATIKELEKKYAFAMFMSGMVGSTRFTWTPYGSYEFIDSIAPMMAKRVDTVSHDPRYSTPSIRVARIPIEFGPAQLRIDKDWKVNNWAFELLFRKLKGEFTCLEIGDMIFIGTPCDFSGEIYLMDSLESYAAQRGKRLIITSFNGDYTGYITFDKHYEVSTKEEINALNWVGPYYGAYFSEMIKKIVDKSQQ